MTTSITPAAFSVDEAARYLRLSRANLYRLFRSGDLKAAKIGGRTLVRRADADELLARAIDRPIRAAEPEGRSSGILA